MGPKINIDVQHTQNDLIYRVSITSKNPTLIYDQNLSYITLTMDYYK